MSGWYIVLNKDGKETPVHNTATGRYLVEQSGGKLIDRWSNRVVFSK